MAAFVYKDAVVTVNSVDISDNVKSATLTYEAEEQDDTAMGDDSRSRIAGLKSWSIEVEWNQNFDASEVDATLFGLVGAAAFPIALQPVSGTISATNPAFTGNSILTSYSPIGGTVGDLAKATTTFPGTGDLTRDVTP